MARLDGDVAHVVRGVVGQRAFGESHAVQDDQAERGGAQQRAQHGQAGVQGVRGMWVNVVGSVMAISLGLVGVGEKET